MECNNNGKRLAEELAEEAGEPVEEYEYDGEIPDLDDLTWEEADAAETGEGESKELTEPL